jgi:hypothetical protein
VLPDAKKALAEQVSSVAERRQLDAAIASGKANQARLVGDLLAIVARLEAKRSAFGCYRFPAAKPWIPPREGVAEAKREWHFKSRAPTARQQAEAWGRRPSEIVLPLRIDRASVCRVLNEQNASGCQEVA